jgi:alkanesulfonate monooxygenase SsuD/methylene tetrahydromethanopterin reductase-like flavin-dependent oxidoreductase (luciferase family)
VGLGLGAGGNAPDFALVGVPFAERNERFDRDLRALVAILRGEDESYARDAAIARIRAEGLPLLTTAMSKTAVRRAAQLGLDIMGSSLLGVEQTRLLVDDYRLNGGTGRHVMILRAWLGEPPRSLMERQLQEYGASAASDGLIAGDDPVELARRISTTLERSHADAVNIRVHVAGLEPERAREQIANLGREVVPLVRKQWSA